MSVCIIVQLFTIANFQAIEGYRETEKIQWQEANQPLIERLHRETSLAVEGKELETLEGIHALDLAADGEIKPHIDSVKVSSASPQPFNILTKSYDHFQFIAKSEYSRLGEAELY